MTPLATKRNEKRYVVGVDIGPNAIRTIRLRRLSSGRFSIEGSHTFPIDPALKFGSADYVSSLKQALRDFCGSARNADFWTSLGGERVRIHHLKIPRMSKGRIAGAVYWALKREEPFNDDETVVDFEVDEKSAADESGPLQVTGFLASREDLEKLTRVFSQAGYPLTGVTLPLYALRNLFRTQWMETPDAPAMFSHIGLSSSGVSILVDGRSVMTRDMPIGLHSFAEALTQELKPPPTPTQASGLILELGRETSGDETADLWKDDDVFAGLRPGLERMARQIERTLEYCQTTYDIQRVKRVYLAGTIAANKRLTDFIAAQISAELVVMDPFESAPPETTLPPPADHAERAGFTLAFGLALSGAERTPNLICTYKDREHTQHARKVSRAIFALFVLVVAGCGAFYAWQQKELGELRAERDLLTRRTQAADPLLNEAIVLNALADVQKQNTRMKATARRYESVAVLEEIDNLTPEYIRLLHVTARLGSPTDNGAAVSSRRLRIEGIAAGERASLETFLTIYVARLEQSPLLRAVEVADSSFKDTEDGRGLFFVLNIDMDERPTQEKSK